jgi:hypothetical protein
MTIRRWVIIVAAVVLLFVLWLVVQTPGSPAHGS